MFLLADLFLYVTPLTDGINKPNDRFGSNEFHCDFSGTEKLEDKI